MAKNAGHDAKGKAGRRGKFMICEGMDERNDE
jgi:hypothetical protein